jgi:hypothetical protein
VKFLCYEDTMQAKCLRLMGKKLLVALAMEGKFAGEGLQTLDEDDDMLTSMAKELVEKNGIGDGADLVWKRLNAEHQRLFPARTETVSSPSESGPAAPVESDAPSHPLIDAALNSEPILVFGQALQENRVARRRSQPAVPEQGWLFHHN